jgi:beta-galactosidase
VRADRGETTLGWPDVSSHFGVLDSAGFAKDASGYYEAWWRDADAQGACAGAASVGVSPRDWTAPVPVGSPVQVIVASCASAAELYVNGERQQAADGSSARAMPRFGFVNWTVPFRPGNLTAVALDATGAVVATRTVLSAGAPAAIRLSVEGGYGEGRNASRLAADGHDAALLRVELLDGANLQRKRCFAPATLPPLRPR